MSVPSVHRGLVEAEGHTKAGRRLRVRVTVPGTPGLPEPAGAVRRDGRPVVRSEMPGGVR